MPQKKEIRQAIINNSTPHQSVHIQPSRQVFFFCYAAAFVLVAPVMAGKWPLGS